MSDADVLSIILQRLNKQDECLDEIKASQTDMRAKMETHMKLEESIRPAVLELVNILHGSKILTRGALWLAGLAGTVWGFFVWAKDHIKL